MSGKRRWKEFLTWWENFKQIKNRKPTDAMEWVLIRIIDSKIEEIKRGRSDSGK